MAKKESKATAEEEAAEQAYLAEQAKKPKPKAQAAEGDIQPREGEEFLPPPDPPVVDSPPFPPPTGYEVDHQQKGAQPEDPAPLRELQLAVEGTRGEGPRPEEPEAPPPDGEV